MSYNIFPQGDGGKWGWTSSKVYNCLQSIELQIVLTAPGHQMVDVPPVGVPDEGGAISKLQKLTELCTGRTEEGTEFRCWKMKWKSHVDVVVYIPVGSVGELQGIKEWVCDGFEVGQCLHYRRGQGDESLVI